MRKPETFSEISGGIKSKHREGLGWIFVADSGHGSYNDCENVGLL